jgi:hypothetical protein
MAIVPPRFSLAMRTQSSAAFNDGLKAVLAMVARHDGLQAPH